MIKKYTTNDELENLCDALIQDYMKVRHYTNSHCLDIEDFVVDYLGLPIVYEKLAEEDHGKIGYISDGIRKLKVWRNKNIKEIIYPKDTIVLDVFLNRSEEIGRKRFTIAHEAAHYVLNKHIPLQLSVSTGFRSEYDGSMVYRPEAIKDMLSLSEMLANRAGACLIMARFLVLRVLKRYNNQQKIIAYDGYVLSQDQKIIIQRMADALGVNYSACFNRLKELNLFEIRPIEEYLTSFKSGGDIA